MEDVRAFLKTLPKKPGVYQMFDANKVLLYVGKAKSLAKRLPSYFREPLSPKTARMMAQVDDIQLMQTHSETEALILECQLIKSHKPRYNILLRDDKSYPYLVITNHAFPRLSYYRGAQKKTGAFFGPYPSTQALRHTMQLLQKVFLIRDCGDSYFSHRTRPCLQYQIKRCSAPCVGKISQQDYALDIASAKAFLRGENEGVISRLQQKMHQASKAQRYEEAAKLRDQITHIRSIQETQHITSTSQRDVDIVAVVIGQQNATVNLLMVRAGRIIGDKNFHLKLPTEVAVDEVLQVYLSQHYLVEQGDVPDALVCSLKPQLLNPLCEAILQQRHQKIKLFSRFSREHRAWLEIAEKNAAFALQQYQLKATRLSTQFMALGDALKKPIISIECFDVSHQSGEATVASDVFFDTFGPNKTAYRRFNIREAKASDDYGALREALTRRVKQKTRCLPDILLIDGGKGQIKIAHEVLQAHGMRDQVALLSIAKGRARHAALDTILHHQDDKIVIFECEDSARELLQFARDEAHRFAIGAHQKTKTKRLRTSVLESIPGIGRKRRKALIEHFGGLQGIKGKSISEIAKVPGINRELAAEVYRYLQEK